MRRVLTSDTARWPARLGPVIGRIDHQLKVYGQTVYPDLLLNIADRCDAVRRSAVCVTHDLVSGDRVRLLLVPAQGQDPTAILAEVNRRIMANLAVSPEVTVTDDADIDAREAAATRGGNMVKIPRFFDLRNPAGVRAR